MARSMDSKRGPLRRTPVSVVFPAGPEIVHREVEEVREVSAFRTPQLNSLAAGLLAVWPPLGWPSLTWPYAGPARMAASSSKPARLIGPALSPRAKSGS